ncbi:MAG: ABC transporter permease [Planctomycetales bacterium]|nr:ABC transporter permease [Planctomycetales bacterium]
MRLPVTLTVALRALAKNKMRASLTVLGVVIGIAAVTTMVSLGRSAGQLVQKEFQSLGTNVIFVVPGQRRRGGVRKAGWPTLTSRDAEAIAEECGSVRAATPMLFTAANVIQGNANWTPEEIVGVGTQYLAVRDWAMHSGGFLTERDITSASKVCVLGHTVVAKLFQTSDPIGRSIRIRNIPFRVIGVLEKKGVNMVGEDQDDIILLPYTTVRKRIQGSDFDYLHAVMVSALSLSLMDEATSEITYLLDERHNKAPGEESDFRVHDTTEVANVLGVITGSMTLMLSAIAGISLIVGGVGIMNIMLVSVSERTREIGIRMAVGARPGDILRQFLVEAVLLSCVGGIVGFLLGVGASVGVTAAINSFTPGNDWPTVISFEAAIVAILFAAAVGIFFGYYPALRASKLDPIDALRYE